MTVPFIYVQKNLDFCYTFLGIKKWIPKRHHQQKTKHDTVIYAKKYVIRKFYGYYSKLNKLPIVSVHYMGKGDYRYEFVIEGRKVFGTVHDSRLNVRDYAIKKMLKLSKIKGV